MGTLYLVRHGQASFGADDYDHLSELGHAQARRLGQYWRERFGDDLRFDAVLTGTLRRQRQTWQGIAEGAALDGTPHTQLPGLNEYDSHALIAAIHPEPLPKPDTPELYRAHFRLLRQGLAAWMRGETAPAGMPSYAAFAQGVADALEQARGAGEGRVLLVSSGGPIATAVARVLQAPPEVSIELNMRYRNTAVSELRFSARRHALLTYNTLPHLDAPAWRDWVSYA
ncbi:histidine phosphatase family protein [Ottowia sp.]|uniref:histidine phosphatase family protein n=1 Tax=Ottowia sp. TaxID=1898956 RepID=UPI0025CC2A14|nr:histidine phosphatase family protein [Ottowia sp.]